MNSLYSYLLQIPIIDLFGEKELSSLIPGFTGEGVTLRFKDTVNICLSGSDLSIYVNRL